MTGEITGASLGLLLASGLLLAGQAGRSPDRDRPAPIRRATIPRAARTSGLSPTRLVAVCLLSGLIACVPALAVTAVPMVAALAAVAGAAVPMLVGRRREVARRRAVRLAWPDAVDVLLSGVRAGMSLPEALGTLGVTGPPPLRPAFAEFAADYRATGSFAVSLDHLQDRLGDPVADRVTSALRLAREFGGPQLGETLRTLSEMLREDARTRAEIAGRQSWTVAAARMAVAAPWVTLALLCTRPEAVRAYATGAGALVLALAAVSSVGAYAVMLRIGRLPTERRMGP